MEVQPKLQSCLSAPYTVNDGIGAGNTGDALTVQGEGGVVKELVLTACATHKGNLRLGDHVHKVLYRGEPLFAIYRTGIVKQSLEAGHGLISLDGPSAPGVGELLVQRSFEDVQHGRAAPWVPEWSRSLHRPRSSWWR